MADVDNLRHRTDPENHSLHHTCEIIGAAEISGQRDDMVGQSSLLLRPKRGMSAKGEIQKLASIAEPNEGAVTNVNPVHLEFFKSVDEIAEAKAELIQGLHDPKIAYLNNDDSRVRAM